jgi:methyl-accepting chemotaxis protein
MNIRTRLYILTVLNVLVCVTVGTVGYMGIERLHPLRDNAGDYRDALEAIDALQSAHETLRADMLTWVSSEQTRSHDVATLDSLKAKIANDSRDVQSEYANLESIAMPLGVPWNVADSKRDVERLTNLAAALLTGSNRDAETRSSQIQIFFDTHEAIRAEASEAKSMIHSLWHRDRIRNIASAHSLQNNVVSALLLGVAFIIALVLITLRSIIRPIGEVITALGASASEVNISAQNMSVYAENLAQSATQQAAAVQESVASMTEMSSMIAQTSDSSIESLTNVRRMAERTQDGNRIMERLASSTEAINQANTQLREMVDIIAEISGKTSVINDIVFKTQLLSFNASIEAARAGQHGRGFAVVAEEFGSLAEISGKAAKEIQSLLETSKKHVHEIVETTHERVSDGLSVSKEALAIFDEISQDTKLITKQIQRISEATREQTIGVHQTSTAMSEMDQAAQQNSLLAGEALRSASGLSEQSRKLAAIMRELLGLVSVYDRGTDSVPTTRPKAAAPKTHIFEVDDDNGSVDLAFLQDAAAKLGKRASLSRKEDPSAENDDVEPYTGRSPR